MTTQGYKRKLTAILSADVKGYSRLMGEDEVATVRTITAYRELVATLIQKHHGRVVDSPGDNMLADFASVVDAVRGAVEIQEELKARNAELPGNRRMEFRIGINLGDVIHEEERIYGDGVNVAARVESLADAGGICVSRSAYDQVKDKLTLGYEYLGEHSVKNIAEPVRIYRVLMEPEAAGKVIGEKIAPLKQRWKLALAAVMFVIVGAIAVTFWNMYFRPPQMEVASVKKMALPLPAKPSIAVLPFSNLSGDLEQEYFSDGITNDIITDLSKFSQLFIIASNTVFTYKGKPVIVKDVGLELGVRYVLEGSVQRANKKVRINAQLIDATTGNHIWAERYDRDLKDLFAVQDEIVQMIVTTLAVKIDALERKRAMRKDTESLEAYDYLLRGWQYYYQKTRSANRKARQMFQKAIELDPQYASAYAAIAWTRLDDFWFGWTEFPKQALQKAHDLAQRALSLEESNASAHNILGSVYLRRAQYDLAVSEFQRAIELNPNDARSHKSLGGAMLYQGRPDEAIKLLETGRRFDPNMGPGDYMHLGLAYYLNGRYDDSIMSLQRGINRNPNFVGNYIALAAAYARLGRSEEAVSAVKMVLRLHPFFEVDSYGDMFRNPADRAAIIDGLQKAGLK